MLWETRSQVGFPDLVELDLPSYELTLRLRNGSDLNGMPWGGSSNEEDLEDERWTEDADIEIFLVIPTGPAALVLILSEIPTSRIRQD